MTTPDRPDHATSPPSADVHAGASSDAGHPPSGGEPRPERGWTQAEIDDEIARLGDVPLYQPPPAPSTSSGDLSAADHAPGSEDPADPGRSPESVGRRGTGAVPSADGDDPDATAVHRIDLDDTVAAVDHRPRRATTGTGSAVTPPMGAGSTAAQRLHAYDWLYGEPRRPIGARAPSQAGSGIHPVGEGPATAPMTPVGAARPHPVAAAVPLPTATARTAVTPVPPARPPHRASRRRRGALTALMLAILLALGTAGVMVGQRLAADGAPLAGLTGSRTPATPPATEPVAGQVWQGPVVPVTGITAQAACVDPPGNDTGTPVPYDAVNLLDDDPATAWRCTEQATPSVTFDLPDDALVAEVGLVNGYAKDTDGTDRYPLYQRALLVRWTFADGSSITQELTDDTRTVQMVRIPVRAGGRVTLEVLKVSSPSVQSATRDSIALSSVVFLAPQV